MNFYQKLFQKFWYIKVERANYTVQSLWPQWIKEYKELKAWSDNNAFQRRMGWGTKYVFPACGHKTPAEISTMDVVLAMRLANERTEHTQRKVLTAMSQFLRWCEAKKIRPITKRLPTDWSLIEPLMGVKTKGREGHHPALDWRDIPRLMVRLSALNTTGSNALMFLILTASRSQPVRMATVHEINWSLKEWHIPANHMKGKQGFSRPHDVPLSYQALDLLLEFKKEEKNSEAFIFSHLGRPLSEATMRKCLQDVNKRLERIGDEALRDPSQGNRVVVPHGFRATFATWAQETGQDLNVVEKCLAHVDGTDRYRGAYRRGKQTIQRRRLLQKWADYCFSQMR